MSVEFINPARQYRYDWRMNSGKSQDFLQACLNVSESTMNFKDSSKKSSTANLRQIKTSIESTSYKYKTIPLLWCMTLALSLSCLKISSFSCVFLVNSDYSNHYKMHWFIGNFIFILTFFYHGFYNFQYIMHLLALHFNTGSHAVSLRKNGKQWQFTKYIHNVSFVLWFVLNTQRCTYIRISPCQTY